MSTVFRSLEPQPRWVYLLRRVLVVAALVVGLVVVVVVVRALTADGGPAEATDPGPGTVSEPPTQEVAPVDPTRACGAADLQLALTADATTYAAGANPTFTVAITNIGASSCTVDAGSAAVEVLITSGTDRIWSSLDCASAEAEGAERMLLLATGAQEAASVPWTRVRSDATCAAGLPAPRAGTYHAVATVQGATSADLPFTLG